LASTVWVGPGVADEVGIVGTRRVDDAVEEAVSVAGTSVPTGVDVTETAATWVGVPVATTLGVPTAVGDAEGTAGLAVPVGVACCVGGVGVLLTCGDGVDVA
jgi:hypothetical protein